MLAQSASLPVEPAPGPQAKVMSADDVIAMALGGAPASTAVEAAPSPPHDGRDDGSAPKVKMMSAEDVLSIASGNVDAPLGGGELMVSEMPPVQSVGMSPTGTEVMDGWDACTPEGEVRAPDPVTPAERVGLTADHVTGREKTELLTDQYGNLPPSPQVAQMLRDARAVPGFMHVGIAATGAEAERLSRVICAHRFEYGPSVAFTSAEHGEGKTGLACAVALAAASAGMRVVLIDACLAFPGASLMAEGSLGGMAELLSNTAGLEDVLVRSESDGLWLVPSTGGLPADESYLSSEAMHSLISTLHGVFDLVVVDAPAACDEPGVVGLASMVGGTVLAVRAHSTERGEVSETVENLQAAGARMMGVVLTHVPATDHVSIGTAALP